MCKANPPAADNAARCTLCPRGCGAVRTARQGGGFCGMGTDPVLARAALHFGEEPCISGTRGSGAVFFSGCALGCVYCQNRKISRERFGRAVSAERLAEIFRELEDAGAHNLNLVSATPYAPAVLRALALARPRVPVVWNSSGYETVETLRMLEGAVDVYLPDLKYVTPERSARYSGAADYFAFAAPALEEMARQTGPAVYDAQGLMTRGTLVRHLILPLNTRESLRVIDWLAERLPDVPVSLMGQYTPCWADAGFPELQRKITPREYDKVVRYALERGIAEGYVQSRNSARRADTPDFDYTGVDKA